MWDSNALFQLIKSMPKTLSKENIERIQMVIDADKYKNSLLSGFDLCDMYMYAPFCRGCRKTSIYPCAIAYINMLRAEGIDVELGARPVYAAEGNVFTPKPAVEEQPVPEVKTEEQYEEIAAAAPVHEEPVENITVEEQPAVQEAVEVEEPATEPVKEVKTVYTPIPNSDKRKIRIAVARKKL